MKASLVILTMWVAGSASAATKVAVCHRPPDNPANFKTIYVGAPAVIDHLAHGDNLVGPEVCDGIDNDCDGEIDEDNVCSLPCSTVATNWCTSNGWQVVPWDTSWPNQPGGSIFCTVDGRSAASDCDGCATYNQIVWKNTAVDACNSGQALQPGFVYGAHQQACICAPNDAACTTWDMQNCIPD